MVECNTPDTVTVNYGLTTGLGSAAKTEIIAMTTFGVPVTTYIHKVKLSNLQSNTVYYYKAVQGSSLSSIFSFRTAVLPGTNFRFLWMSDTQDGNVVHDKVNQKMILRNAYFSLYGGDLSRDSTYTYWKNDFFRTYELNIISSVPFFSSPGNHEGWNQNTKTFEMNPQNFSGTQDYYSFDYGDVHFISINNAISYVIGSQQYNFIQSDLAASNKLWKIAYFHKSAYVGGGAGEDTAMKRISQNLFVPNHVDIVFTGHSHFYQHNLISGIHHMVMGGAGGSLATPTNASYTIRSIKKNHYGVIDMSPGTLFLRVYDTLDVQIDSVRIDKATNINNQNEKIGEFQLSQNYPNPFNPETKISFEIKNNSGNKPVFASLKIYNILGNEICTLINDLLKPGNYNVSFDGSGIPTGIYFYKFSTDERTETKKMVLLK
jgi:predicted phosphodiesterase